MPATLSQLRRPILVDHTVDFGDDIVVTFRFDRNKITDAWLREWAQLEATPDATSAINQALADLIHAWDITNDDGSAFPPTADNIGAVFSLPDKSSLVQELMQAGRPTRAEGKASSEPSSTPPSTSEAPAPTSPNGPTTLPSPAGSASPSLT